MKYIICSFANERCCITDIVIIIRSTALGGPWPPLFVLGFVTIFLRHGLIASRPTPNMEDKISLLVWVITLALSGMEDPTTSYDTASITPRIM